MKAVARLQEYVKLDNDIIDKNEESDFTKFCESHCEDILAVLDCVDQIDFLIKNLDSSDFYDTHDYLVVKDFLKKITSILQNIID